MTSCWRWVLRVIRLRFIVFVDCDWLQFGTGDGTARVRLRYRHDVDGRVNVLGPVQADGKYEEAERKTLTREDENEQVRAHCPVVVDEAGTFVTAARSLLPRDARFVDEESKQDWSRYHPCMEIHTIVLISGKVSVIHFVAFHNSHNCKYF